MYTTRQFVFENQKLIITSSSYQKKGGRSDSLLEATTTTIDVKNLLRCYLCSESDSTRPNKYYAATFCLDFKQYQTGDKDNVVEYDHLKKKQSSSYYTRFTILTLNSELRNDNIPKRIEKAFAHLISLYGGNPVKDVF
jgi:hypothetical protein